MKKGLPCRYLAAALLAMLPVVALCGVISPELARELASRASSDEIPVIIQFSDRVDPSKYKLKDRKLRNNDLMLALKDKADRVQGPVKALLDLAGAKNLKQLWLINGIAVTVPAGAIDQLARDPSVGRIQFDAPVPLAVTPQSTPTAAGWNLAAIHAPDVWTLGYTGSGIVVANMDTGVDPSHPDLTGKWRGGSNSWFDPYGQHASPYDFSGHGTQTMGLMVGGAASGTAIGVAPDARWIATKIYDDAGVGTLSKIHLSFQWLMDPDGNPATIDAPDVVNASWGLAGAAPGACNLEFNDDILALKTAGIAVVLAAGNDGPAQATSLSPANNPAAYSAGAVDNVLALLGQSSRGPSGCDGSIFPKLVAPGVNVVTSDLSFGGLPVYASVSGTSFAAPHVSGSMVLLAQAFPTATIAQIESALIDSARDLGPAGADNDYGYGLNDALAAYNLLLARVGVQHAPTITSAPPTTVLEGQPYQYQMIATDADGGPLTFALGTAPAGMAIDPAGGLVTWSPTHAQVGANAVVLVVTDPTRLSASQSFSVSVARINNPPVAANDSYSVAAGGTLSVASPGVLANDTDPDGDPITAVPVTGPAHGVLTLSANGSFTYVPSAGYSGSDSFSYRATDGYLSSNTAVVSLTVTAPVNTPPVAGNDAFTAPLRKTTSYTAQIFNVLANDRDPDGTLDVASVTLVGSTSAGGAVSVNANGTVSYTPKQKFTGVETFKYQVKDNRGAWSNVATVSVTVR